MSTADVLVCGLGGPGLEIAKNIVLAGVRSVTLHDKNPITMEDLSSQFYADKKDVGSSRDIAFKDQLSSLNLYVSLHVLDKPKLDESDFKRFTVVVLTQASHEQCVEIGDICHKFGVKLVIASTFGLFGRVFTDFGDQHTVLDPSGETPAPALVQLIEKVSSSY